MYKKYIVAVSIEIYFFLRSLLLLTFRKGIF